MGRLQFAHRERGMVTVFCKKSPQLQGILLFITEMMSLCKGGYRGGGGG